MKTSSMAAAALAAAVAVPVAALVGPAPAPTIFTPGKCDGIAKASLNDCQTRTHSCAGTSTKLKFSLWLG